MIKITVASYDNVAPTLSIAAVFNHERKTMGRSDANFFVLPDARHEVSRSQAAVWSDGLRHMMINLSHATPIRINGREILSEKETEIQVGDEIQIGPYLLRAEQADARDQPPSAAALARPAAALDCAAPEQCPSPAPVGAGDGHAIEALKTAFLRGAGLPKGAIASDLTPELMELVGQLLADSVQGMIELIALRALVKQEVKADVTMVVVRNNNPLKFFPDSQTVLTQMLRKKMPGFMAPLESIADACQDLRSHQMGMVAGMSAALGSMLERLNPENFKLELAKRTWMDSLIPCRRQAAMWETYSIDYANIAKESPHESKTLFGPPFLAAYEMAVTRFNDGVTHD